MPWITSNWPLERLHRLAMLAVALIVTLGVSACSSDDPTDPQPKPKGALRVEVSTVGTATDPDGYTLTLAPGGASRSIGANDVALFTGLEPGNYEVTLSDLDPGCLPVGGSAVMAAVIAGSDTAKAAFTVTCSGVVVTGGIDVAIVTTGALPPDDYMVVLDGMTTATAPVGSVLPDTARVSFTNVPVGTHQVSVTNIPGGCAVTSLNPADVDVTANGTAKVEFEVSCTSGAVPRGIVFVSPNPGTGVSNIWTMNADGTGITQLTFDAHDQWLPSFSPAGDKIVYYQDRLDQFGTPLGDVWIMDADGANPVNLTIGITGFVGAGGFWSPDGTQLVILGTLNDGAWNYYIMDLAARTIGSHLITDVSQLPVLGKPDWSPDGELIVFSAQWGGGQSIWTVSAGGGAAVLLADDNPFSLTDPAWSPQGDTIVLERGNYGIWAMDKDGLNLRELVADDINGGSDPTWLPDGRIGFTPMTLTGGLVVINADGSGRTTIGVTDPVIQMYQADWNSNP